MGGLGKVRFGETEFGRYGEIVVFVVIIVYAECDLSRANGLVFYLYQNSNAL